jgi:KaiC/GvpD/RAD55 family RecA-like ATPase
VEKVLYRLPEIVKATDVFIVEGEKDVHTLEKMGMVATTSPFGAGKFLPEFAKYFNKSHHVVIIPDNDKPGRDHAEQAAAVLNGHVGSLKILTLANLSPSGDVSDWAEGRDPYEAGEELCKLAEGAPEYQENGTSECLWTGQILTLEEAFKRRQEREYVVTGLIALPSLTIVYGPPGSLKTFLVADLAISVAGGLQWLGGFECGNENRGVIAFETTRHTVLCLDFDNGRDRTEERLAALARDRNLSVDLPLRYVSMPSPWLDASSESQMDELEKTIERVGAKLVIVDNLCVVSGKVEENSAEMGTVMANWRRLAEKLRIAILIVHHQTKGNNKDSRPGNSLRGHSSIEASLDLALQVEREGQSDIIRINPTKVRGADVAPFGARFTYEHLPGTDILEKARFFGHEAEDVSGSQVIEEKIMEVLREHLSAYGAPNKSALTVKVQKELNAKPGNKTPIGVNRIRGIIDVLEAEDKLSVTPGKQGAKLYCLPNGK